MDLWLEMERIKQLKARYFRTLDTNDWAGFAACLTLDCKARYQGGKLSLDGRDEITAFMQRHMSSDSLLSMHNGHHPEISVETGGIHASGIWYLQDTIIDLKRKTQLTGGAIYTDAYRKEGGEWLISSTGYHRTFECVEPLHERHRVLQNMFQPRKP